MSLTPEQQSVVNYISDLQGGNTSDKHYVLVNACAGS